MSRVIQALIVEDSEPECNLLRTRRINSWGNPRRSILWFEKLRSIPTADKLLFIMLAIWAVLSACQPNTQIVPVQLLGRWITEDSRYKGVSFEITSSAITLRTVEGSTQIYGISKFESAGEGKRVSYVLYGDRDGQQQQFAFFYTPVGGGELRFKNQIEIRWTKAAAAGPSDR